MQIDPLDSRIIRGSALGFAVLLHLWIIVEKFVFSCTFLSKVSNVFALSFGVQYAYQLPIGICRMLIQIRIIGFDVPDRRSD